MAYGRDLTRVEDAATIPGTTIEVSELFFIRGPPKFLKSTTGVLPHQPCGSVDQLAWPQVYMRLVHNGYEVFAAARCPRSRDRVPRCIGQRSVSELWPSMSSAMGLLLKGFIIDPVRALRWTDAAGIIRQSSPH